MSSDGLPLCVVNLRVSQRWSIRSSLWMWVEVHTFFIAFFLKTKTGHHYWSGYAYSFRGTITSWRNWSRVKHVDGCLDGHGRIEEYQMYVSMNISHSCLNISNMNNILFLSSRLIWPLLEVCVSRKLDDLQTYRVFVQPKTCYRYPTN